MSNVNDICAPCQSWKQLLAKEKQKDYFKSIIEFINKEKASGKEIYPESDNIFRAISSCPFDKVKVVILGQDPYHGPGQAHGLAFSVPSGVPAPPSLKNIFKEIHSDLDISPPSHGNLEGWTKQGVLLLNTSLSVERGKAGSHSKIGWSIFTDKIVELLNEYRSNLVFMLWGAHAQKKGENIDQAKHLVLRSTHPSPLSAHRGFFGCKHFSKANQYLEKNGINTINWGDL